MSNSNSKQLLSQLKKVTTVVADTGDINSIKQYHPQDATTNPSLLLKSAQDPAYKEIFDKSVLDAKGHGGDLSNQLYWARLHLAANFGCEILKLIPGKVSTEVDARHSFSAEKTISEARDLIKLYEKKGVDSSRVLLKVAATWEGVQAAKVLQKDGLNCNMTLIFHLAQAIACADVNSYLISPFVGRITDWYKANSDIDVASNDPGVASVVNIYNYFHHFGYKTIVMGASFRNIGQIKNLSGCDYLTISPNLLEELKNIEDDLVVNLSDSNAKSESIEKIDINEESFRWLMNEDAMATEKLSDGIRKFTADIIKLDSMLMDALRVTL
jgi:transaldolase